MESGLQRRDINAESRSYRARLGTNVVLVEPALVSSGAAWEDGLVENETLQLLLCPVADTDIDCVEAGQERGDVNGEARAYNARLRVCIVLVKPTLVYVGAASLLRFIEHIRHWRVPRAGAIADLQVEGVETGLKAACIHRNGP